MNKNNYLRILLVTLLIFVTASISVGLADQTDNQSGKMITVTDLAGKTVEIPSDVKHVACISGPSLEKTYLVGGSDKIAMITPFVLGMPWAVQIIPDLKKMAVQTTELDPNIEELMKANIDLVFFWDYDKPIEKMNEVGIPVLTTTQIVNTPNKPDTEEKFTTGFKREVALFGDVFGLEGQKKAADYAKYFDEKVDNIVSVTSKIPQSEKPNVYYAGGVNALKTQGLNTYTNWWVEMAGGNFVSKEITQQKADVTVEQVAAWNPDIIMMGRINSTDVIMNDPKWQDIKAVKDNKVFICPEGVFYWDYSSEGILLLEYLAKTFHPEKFADIDMNKEIKEFYSRFYNYDLTDTEADRILSHLPPV
ncbi:MAG TPA: ABC transporter substrate-binding protein [Methanospirillum sp.]|nr:ABC transporter substrate-binding protein [Methanospirillum sp.]